MNKIEKLLQEKILIIDGAMGTMIQRYKLNEEDYRGAQFKNWQQDIKGNNDVLNITQPRIITDLHIEFLKAGANIIETNTFNAQQISMADYNMEEYSHQINFAAAKAAQNAIKEYQKTEEGHNRKNELFVAGSLGPLNKTLSISPDVNNPGYRALSFDEAASAYKVQVKGLIEGGVDLLLIETIFDTLNAKAAIFAIKEYFSETKQNELPIMISGTITDASGRTLSGQTLEAFYISIEHANPLTVGLNCALGATEMKPYIEELSQISKFYVSAYPNAGLPNEMGEYDESPDITASIIKEWAENGWVNVVGGCCGTTPDHIKEIVEVIRNIPPRKLQKR